MLGYADEDTEKMLKQIKANLKDDDNSSSQIESVGTKTNLLHLEKSGKEIWKKHKKSKIIRHKKGAAETGDIQTSQLHDELLYPENNTAYTERVKKSKKLDSHSAISNGTLKSGPKNQMHLQVEESTESKKKINLKKSRRENEDRKLCDIDQEYENIALPSFGPRKRRTKQKGILLEATTRVDTLMIDVDQKDYFGKCKKKKKKKTESLD